MVTSGNGHFLRPRNETGLERRLDRESTEILLLYSTVIGADMYDHIAWNQADPSKIYT